MDDKNSIKNQKPTYRKVVIIDKEELKELRKYFSLFGTKAEFTRETGVYTDSLTRILRAGKGEKRIVEIIRSFIESQNETAA